MVPRLLEQIISRLLAEKTRSRACSNVAMLPSELSSTFKYVFVEYGTPTVFEDWMKAILSKRKLSFSSLYDALIPQKMQILNFSTGVILLKPQEEREERIALGHVGLEKSHSSAISRRVANIFFPGNFFVHVIDCLVDKAILSEIVALRIGKTVQWESASFSQSLHTLRGLRTFPFWSPPG
ncbi:unnamed protein product [Albugo candida]|uniref:Uncharacterized protein n=1 Tax=Albugo candida TaxID=65357 RepID=A0A024FVQ4_9STRA|nr:unnamed protein product [Albugo candida]|eukprot:CCI11210.1 unnamed protein product [Albugo candida]